MSRIDSNLSRELVDEALRSDDRFVIAHQTDPMFRAVSGRLHSEVHALLETIAAGGGVHSPHAFALAYAVRRLTDEHRTIRDLAVFERHLRATTDAGMRAASSLRAEFGG